jgi:DNA-binding NarL/FixJ family response regulator
MPTPIRVMLVDDQALLRTGFRMVLAAQPDMEVVAEAGNGVEALEVLRATEVDVVLMDVRMPKLDGVETTRRICARRPEAGLGGPPKVLILTTFDLDEYAFSALKAGAGGFMLKDVPPGELLTAIRAVHSGDAVVAPSTTRRLLDRFAPMLPSSSDIGPRGGGRPEVQRLTEREREVMLLVAQGMSNGEIAAQLVLSEATVKTHVGRILTKLGVRDRVQVVVMAYETGLVQAGGGPTGFGGPAGFGGPGAAAGFTSPDGLAGPGGTGGSGASGVGRGARGTGTGRGARGARGTRGTRGARGSEGPGGRGA